MHRLSRVFRQTYALKSFQDATLRGPKKKKGAGGPAAPESSDIVNIFKERKDPLIYPSDMYPPYVMSLLDPQYTPDEMMMQIYRGERMPSSSEQWRLAKAIRRNNLKDRNWY